MNATNIPRELNRWIGHCLRRIRSAASVHLTSLILRELSGDMPGARHLSGRSRQTEVESLAVLPFFTSSNSPDAEYLADGMTESLINNLAQLTHLRVVARSTVFRHKGRLTIRWTGRELKVDAVLTGNFPAARSW
jgi:TolB-like protein